MIGKCKLLKSTHHCYSMQFSCVQSLKEECTVCLLKSSAAASTCVSVCDAWTHHKKLHARLCSGVCVCTCVHGCVVINVCICVCAYERWSQTDGQCGIWYLLMWLSISQLIITATKSHSILLVFSNLQLLCNTLICMKLILSKWVNELQSYCCGNLETK